MARSVLYKARNATQAGVDVMISDGWMDIMMSKSSSAPFTKNANFWRIVDRYFRRAMQQVENQMRRNATAMSAVATGWMRDNTVSSVVVDMGKPIPIVATVGTMAWYDILIEKGLGRHSPTGYLPPKYKPTEAQKAIVPTREQARLYWKKSPKKPRPFMAMAVKQTRTTVTKLISIGFKAAFKSIAGKYGKKPRHSLKAIGNSAQR